MTHLKEFSGQTDRQNAQLNPVHQTIEPTNRPAATSQTYGHSIFGVPKKKTKKKWPEVVYLKQTIFVAKVRSVTKKNQSQQQ